MNPVYLPPIDIILSTGDYDTIGHLTYGFFDNKIDFEEYISEFKHKYENIFIIFVYDTLNDEMRELCRTWEWEICPIKDN